jgi:hypothetical protein
MSFSSDGGNAKHSTIRRGVMSKWVMRRMKCWKKWDFRLCLIQAKKFQQVWNNHDGIDFEVSKNA